MIRSLLLVDDDLLDQTMFKLALRNFDPAIEVRTALNGLQGLEELEKKIPDIIFLDQNMPQMNGVEFLKKMKADKRFESVPVVVFTPSMYLTAHNQELIKLGAWKYVVKDISFNGKGSVINVIREFNKQTAA